MRSILLGALFGLVLVLAYDAGTHPIGAQERPAKKKKKATKKAREEAVAEIHKAGGTIVQRVVEVDLRGVHVLDQHFEHLSVLTPVQVLHLNTTCTPTQFAFVDTLHNLETLNLEGATLINDAALVHLEGLNLLRHLNLVGTSCTPAGVARLQLALPDVKIVFRR